MSTPNLIGKQLGTYEVCALIGSGGMAQVYRGFDLNLQRPVAIKVLSDLVATQPGFAYSFRQEAQMIARLHHPHIVQVYNFGEQDGLTYMVQELLPGPSLDQHLRSVATRGQLLGRQDIVSITSQLASALDAAHAAGIVHRDVKPGNALWSASGALVLTDFGIAQHNRTDQQQPCTGMLIGTPDYFSPEQAQGAAGTQASDIYALGVVIYEMLTGRVPFHGETHQEVIQQHRTIAPPPLHLLRENALPAVEEVVQRALAKQPEQRFSSAGALAYALKRAWPPSHEREPRISPRAAHESDTGFWGQAPVIVTFQADHNGKPDRIHYQTTLIAVNQPTEAAEAADVAHTEKKITASLPVDTPLPAPEPELLSAQVSVFRGWHTFAMMVGTLVLVLVLGTSVMVLQDDYLAALNPTAVPVAYENITARPTLIATARISPRTPTPQTSSIPVENAGLPVRNTIDSPTALVTPSVEMPTPAVLPTVDTLLALSLPQQLEQLRVLVEADRTEGWARIEPDAWLVRLDDIEHALEEGNTEQAALWLQEIRQAMQRDLEMGAIDPDLARQMIASIDNIAVSNDLDPPPVTEPGIEDG